MVLTLEDEINSLIHLVNLEQRKLLFMKMVFEDDSNTNNNHNQDTINHDDHQINSHYFDSSTNNNNNSHNNMDDIIIASNNNKIQSDSDNPIMSNIDNNSNQNLVPCPLCDRKFISDRLEKHLIICKKIKEKKRKLFDAAKQRAENLDKINNTTMEISVPPPSSPPPQPKPRVSKNKRKTTNNDSKTNAAANEPKSDNNNNSNNKQSNWRQQHQEFIRTIRAARGAPLVQDGDDPSLLESNTDGGGSLPPGIVECPTCFRRFSIKAADRHINWCAENVRKQKEKTNQNQNNNKNQEALERMKARTKYKPLLPGTNKNDSNSTKTTAAAAGETPKRTRSLPRSNSSTALSTSSNQNNLAKSNSKTTKLKDDSNNSKNMNVNTNRRNTKVISKSSENLSTKKAPMIKSLSPASKRTPANNRNQIQQKKVTNNNHSKSKVDSGIGSGGYQKQKNKEKSAPIMKFKEKFPNHHHQNNVKSIIDQFQDIEHILRRNSFIDDSPKTVPGVRTGGISPVKNMARNTPLNEMEKSMSKSETSLHRMDDDDNDDRGIGSGSGDIKSRIDQYITRLYDNNNNNTSNNETTLWQSHNNMANGLINGYNGLKLNSNGYHHGGRINNERQNSANSDTEARMSTSDSTDSGLGAVLVSNNSQSLLETVNETDGKITSVVNRLGDSGNGGDRSSSKNSSRTFRADVLSPTMSDIETNNRLLLRNSSLNDIEVLNRDDLMLVGPNHGTMINSYHHHQLPRFCYQCGTKYPNVIAKFCYECGSRRFETV